MACLANSTFDGDIRDLLLFEGEIGQDEDDVET